MVLTVHDITQLKQAEKQLALAKEKAENSRPFEVYLPRQYESRNPHASQRHHGICRNTCQRQYGRRKGHNIRKS